MFEVLKTSPRGPAGQEATPTRNESPARRAEITVALRRGLSWLYALEGRAAAGEEGELVSPGDVAVEIAEVEGALRWRGADIDATPAIRAGARTRPPGPGLGGTRPTGERGRP